jgi:hypothetical protein
MGKHHAADPDDDGQQMEGFEGGVEHIQDVFMDVKWQSVPELANYFRRTNWSCTRLAKERSVGAQTGCGGSFMSHTLAPPVDGNKGAMQGTVSAKKPLMVKNPRRDSKITKFKRLTLASPENGLIISTRKR